MSQKPYSGIGMASCCVGEPDSVWVSIESLGDIDPAALQEWTSELLSNAGLIALDVNTAFSIIAAALSEKWPDRRFSLEIWSENGQGARYEGYTWSPELRKLIELKEMDPQPNGHEDVPEPPPAPPAEDDDEPTGV